MPAIIAAGRARHAISAAEALEILESSPRGLVAKHTRAVDADQSAGDRGSIACAGTTVARGRGDGVVVAIGKATERPASAGCGR